MKCHYIFETSLQNIVQIPGFVNADILDKVYTSQFQFAKKKCIKFRILLKLCPKDVALAIIGFDAKGMLKLLQTSFIPK